MLSAKTKQGLFQNMAALSKMLSEAGEVDMRDLAWTLHARRTEFPIKAAFAAANKEELIRKLDAACVSAPAAKGIGLATEDPFATLAVKVSQKFPLRILGVFTGQGAQWPAMGAMLHAQSESFRCSFDNMERSLSRLPVSERPHWGLVDELLAPAITSRIDSPEISQPLTTAVQIALVDLLRISNVKFAGVVGHSSGEIAAAYAAGFLEAADAIRIAYYRGLYSRLARSTTTAKRGKMMAVGMSLKEAQSLCNQERFEGRICVAACNSRSSITLSGDADAIHEAATLLEHGQRFARILKVDTAYHSHHVEACAIPYGEALGRCNISPKASDGKCQWFSSVHGPSGRSIQDHERFRSPYWVDNLIRPVLFQQSVERAIQESFCFDMAVEVGPHHALKGPVSDTWETLTGVKLPYYGVLKRNENDMTAICDTLGWIRKNVSARDAKLLPNLEAFTYACGSFGDSKPRLFSSPRLPSYAWDHGQSLLQESRQSRRWRRPDQPLHELLGRAFSYGDADHREMHWRNVLKTSELGWLQGHQFQQQVLFPAAGYVSMAAEAARHLAASIDEHSRIALIELQDLKFHKAMSFEDDFYSSGVEVTFTIKVIKIDSHHIVAEYSCHSGGADTSITSSAEMDKITQTNFTGRTNILLQHPSRSLASCPLPARISPSLPMLPMDTQRFYSWALWIGLQYSGDFVANSIRRRLNVASVSIKRAPDQ